METKQSSHLIRSYSWEIRGNFCAVKTVDKTLLNEGTTGIPNAISWFFVSQPLKEGGEIEVSLVIAGVSARCVVSKRQGRHRLFFGKFKQALFNLTLGVGDLLFFEKVSTTSDVFFVSVLGADNEVRSAFPTENLVGEDRAAYTTARVGHQLFREQVRGLHQYRCCVCNVNDLQPSILIASHIKPWSESDQHEKVDKYNGLLLAPHFDKLFDKGHISFKSDGNMVLSSAISDSLVAEFKLENRKLHLVPKQTAQYLEYHRHHFGFQ